MPCDCAQFQPIELDRQSITRRIKQSPAIRKRLTQIAENTELRIYLFRCPDCGQLWQSGHEWNFADQEYLFQVPPIEVAEWEREPYQQPAAMMIYSAVMRDLFARSKFEVGDSPCRIEGCQQRALRLSVFCRDHHIESIQQRGRLPKKPVGRLFPPYYVETPNVA
ncbi:MAG: hypothetical protein PHD76_08585 [Methylacidiphilales bacterium]|nr:hypothetical protein [Candidatus Methylacidiphilales bacterium]